MARRQQPAERIGDELREAEGLLARAIALVSVLAFAVLLVRTAWLCDDAFISFRCSANLVEGHGLRWNADERVQVFTNPLWTLVMAAAYALSNDFYASALLLGGILSLLAYGTVVRVGGMRSWGVALLVSSLLLSSLAWVDYSTSGLENPLGHLLLALFAIELLAPDREPRWPRLCLLAGFLVLNRMDSVLLVLPGLILVGRRHRDPAGVRAAILGALPFAAWLLFSIVYYGHFLPNTAQAKLLGLGIPRPMVLAQGGEYLLHTLKTDPVTALAVLSGIGLAARGSAGARALGLGIGLHLAYLVWAGGDFMAGRWLAAPCLISTALVARQWPSGRRATLAAAGSSLLVFAIGFAGERPGLTSGPDLDDTLVGPNGISDERAYYFQRSGLISRSRASRPWNGHMSRPGRLAPDERVMWFIETVGMPGFCGGPKLHIVDEFGLGDPLLARLPAADPSAFKPGHVRRRVPEGYPQTLWTGENRLVDPDLAACWEDLRLVSRAPLFTRERLGAVWRTLTGGNLERIECYVERSRNQPRTRELPASRLVNAVTAGTPWHARELIALVPGEQVRVRWSSPVRASRLEVFLDANDSYELVFASASELRGRVIVPVVSTDPAAGQAPRLVLVPEPARSGFDSVEIAGYTGDGLFALGGLRVLPDGDQ